MRHIPIILLVVLSFCTAGAYAQTTGADASTASGIPSGPLLRPAPNFFQWTITFSYSEEQKAKEASEAAGTAKFMPTSVLVRPRTTIATKTGKIIHEETKLVNGDSLDDWQAEGSYYIKYPGQSMWSAFETSAAPDSGGRAREELVLPASGFRGLEWINSQAYAGRMKTEWGDCLIFVPGGRSAVNGDLSKEKLASLPAVAYVDAETRLPVMVRGPQDGTRVFTFAQPPPASMQTLPQDLTAEIKAGDAIRAQRNAAPQREY